MLGLRGRRGGTMRGDKKCAGKCCHGPVKGLRERDLGRGAPDHLALALHFLAPVSDRLEARWRLRACMWCKSNQRLGCATPARRRPVISALLRLQDRPPRAEPSLPEILPSEGSSFRNLARKAPPYRLLASHSSGIQPDASLAIETRNQARALWGLTFSSAGRALRFLVPCAAAPGCVRKHPLCSLLRPRGRPVPTKIAQQTRMRRASRAFSPLLKACPKWQA